MGREGGRESGGEGVVVLKIVGLSFLSNHKIIQRMKSGREELRGHSRGEEVKNKNHLKFFNF